jgi:hypothetical protein
MTRVVGAWPMNLLDLWYPSAVEVVAEKGDFEVEVVGAGGGECDCAVVMAVVEVVDLGFGCATELRALLWHCFGSFPYQMAMQRPYPQSFYGLSYDLLVGHLRCLGFELKEPPIEL